MTALVQVGPSPSGGGPVPSPVDWEDVLADIGDRVRAERIARGWSQAELARRCGVIRDTIRGLEGGRASLRAFVLACTALGVEMSHLLSDQWEMPARAARMPLTPKQVKVLRAVEDGAPLAAAADRLGMPVGGLASRLSEIYRRLEVTWVPRGPERRAAAVRVAREKGLLVDAA